VPNGYKYIDFGSKHTSVEQTIQLNPCLGIPVPIKPIFFFLIQIFGLFNPNLNASGKNGKKRVIF
jgi:hypothetical protein